MVAKQERFICAITSVYFLIAFIGGRDWLALIVSVGFGFTAVKSGTR